MLSLQDFRIYASTYYTSSHSVVLFFFLCYFFYCFAALALASVLLEIDFTLYSQTLFVIILLSKWTIAHRSMHLYLLASTWISFFLAPSGHKRDSRDLLVNMANSISFTLLLSYTHECMCILFYFIQVCASLLFYLNSLRKNVQSVNSVVGDSIHCLLELALKSNSDDYYQGCRHNT